MGKNYWIIMDIFHLQYPNWGIGTNLNCLSGTVYSRQTDTQLSLYKLFISLTTEIPQVSGGTPAMHTAILKKCTSQHENHLNWEALFFAKDLRSYETFRCIMMYLNYTRRFIEFTERTCDDSTGELESGIGIRMWWMMMLTSTFTAEAILDIGPLDS
jgi:hypothetical protein